MIDKIRNFNSSFKPLRFESLNGKSGYTTFLENFTQMILKYALYAIKVCSACNSVYDLIKTNESAKYSKFWTFFKPESIIIC